jgi:IS1 family transposase/transposase-like protein
MLGENMSCPNCGSHQFTKNGINATGKQNYRCKDCDRQFVIDPLKSPISNATKEIIDRLLLERISLAGIARVTGVSESWLQSYVNQKYQNVPREISTKKKTAGHLVLECDEMWSFVGNKDNKQWVWLALDRDTREIVGVYIGRRDAAAAQALWASLPQVYRERAVSYTDFWEAYQTVIPPERHHAVGKESGQTNHIERFNGTLRQRASRLVRKTLSFSKKLANHIGAIWYFVHHYNATRPINQVP